MALPILFDCDPGHDDAIAIVLALASPELDVKAITSSAGNQTPDKMLRNVLRMLTLLNRTDIPVAGGAVKPLMRDLIIADNVHGESGLDGPALWASCAMLLPVLLGMAAGERLRARLSATAFKRALMGSLLALGLYMLGA